MVKTMKTKFNCVKIPRDLAAGLAELQQAYPDRFGQSAAAYPLSFAADAKLPAGGVRIQTSGGEGVTINYQSRSAAFRGLGSLLALNATELKQVNVEETAAFSMRGLMFDCSRNGVLKPETLKNLLRRVSLMGINMVMLYTEDTYEVPGEPFFGYLRGAYTFTELKDLDRYALALGIEMIPCIQTLGHMQQMLQWYPNVNLRDTMDILLAGDEKVYELIRKMIKAVSAPFTSKRIHLGMDEAGQLGTGRYRRIHGEQNRSDIMNLHLARVRDICRESGLQPMIWSDMYFRLGSETHDYYDLNWKLPEKARSKIPRDVQLVYWDYYHDDVDFYRKMIAFHRQLGSDPVFAGGIWTWAHKWCALPWAFTTIRAGMKACKAEGVRESFMTMWGDDGMEVDCFSALPGIQMYCEYVFAKEVNPKTVARRFEAVCDGSHFKDWVRAADIDSVPHIEKKDKSNANTSCSLLWQDPMLSIMDPHIWRPELRKHYEKVAVDLQKGITRGTISERLTYPMLIARAIAARVNLRKDLSAALKRKDKDGLRKLMSEVKAARKAVKTLWRYHRTMWLSTYKPFGWEVLEHRYGGLMTRLETLEFRLQDYLADRISSIPELEATLHDPWPEKTKDVDTTDYARVKTPSSIK